MKAIVYQKYGSPDVLEIKEVERPVPKDNEVLVKVQAASVNPYDLHYLKGTPYFIRMTGAGLLKPKNKILGADITGKVEVAGSNAKQFQPGDQVYGQADFGAFAEYVCVPENRLALKPSNLTLEEAAAVPMTALTALQGLRDIGHIQSGQKVLIYGASGGIGTFAVQIAKYFGTEVTGVCSTGNLDMVKSIGADHVIDYTREDFTKNSHHYNLIFATSGYRSILDYRRALCSGGIYVLAGGYNAQLFQAMFLGPWVSMTGNRKMKLFIEKPGTKDLLLMKDLLEAGKVKPIVDRRYPLEEVAEALRYLEKGHARGKVVITVEHNTK